MAEKKPRKPSKAKTLKTLKRLGFTSELALTRLVGKVNVSQPHLQRRLKNWQAAHQRHLDRLVTDPHADPPVLEGTRAHLQLLVTGEINRNRERRNGRPYGNPGRRSINRGPTGDEQRSLPDRRCTWGRREPPAKP
jgi:hypothetical protein